MHYANLPTIDAAPTPEHPKGRPFLWVLLVLLAASAAVGAWTATMPRDEGDIAPAPAPLTNKEKEAILESLAASSTSVSEEDRFEAMSGLSASAGLSLEEMQQASERIN